MLEATPMPQTGRDIVHERRNKVIFPKPRHLATAERACGAVGIDTEIHYRRPSVCINTTAALSRPVLILSYLSPTRLRAGHV